MGAIECPNGAIYPPISGNLLPDDQSDYRVEIVSHTSEVLRRAREIRPLVAGTPQEFELADIPYFLEKPGRLAFIPHLLMVYKAGTTLAGAVLLIQFGSILRSQRIFSSMNRRGRRTVFAPDKLRVEIASIAARTLFQRGAHFINVEFDVGERDTENASTDLAWSRARAVTALHLCGLSNVAGEWALHAGLKRFDLLLTQDLNRTLAALGRRTRRNLRYYRKLCVRELGCRFEPSIIIPHEEFLELNQASTHRASRKTAEWRYKSLVKFSNTFLAGMRNAQGRLLSLIGGRRNGTAVEIDWQLNRSGFERFSLSTATRCFLIEYEVIAGSTSLSFEGGTAHQLAESLRLRSTYGLALRRPSLIQNGVAWILGNYFPDKLVSTAMYKPWRNWSRLPPQQWIR